MLAKRISKFCKKVDLIFSTNTISHIPDYKETFDAIDLLLSKNGVLVVEDPYVGSVLKLNSYDQFYDEHVYVFSLMAISILLNHLTLEFLMLRK